MQVPTIGPKIAASVVAYFQNEGGTVNISEWRIINVNGQDSRKKMLGRVARYGVCCPNSPGYRKFVSSQIEELCTNYDFEGVFFDMTFWPTILLLFRL
jgi:uncharacterized lipoprotein YddW (UPF0748 family)